MNSPADGVFDRGLQLERTLLAWRRTCLSFGLTSLIALRFTVEELGVFAVLAGLVVACFALLAYTFTALEYRRRHAQLHRGQVLAHGGPAVLFATIAVLVIGVICAGFLLQRM